MAGLFSSTRNKILFTAIAFVLVYLTLPAITHACIAILQPTDSCLFLARLRFHVPWEDDIWDDGDRGWSEVDVSENDEAWDG